MQGVRRCACCSRVSTRSVHCRGCRAAHSAAPTRIKDCSGCRRVCCAGSAICAHNRIRSRCKECGGASICIHARRKSECIVSRKQRLTLVTRSAHSHYSIVLAAARKAAMHGLALSASALGCEGTAAKPHRRMRSFSYRELMDTCACGTHVHKHRYRTLTHRGPRAHPAPCAE